MTGPASRRGFLRNLTTLPLIGGVTLIGAPTAVPDHEARFLALAPVLVPMLDEFDRLWAPCDGLFATADAAFPGAHDGEREKAKRASPEWRAYSNAWDAANAVSERLGELYEPFLDERMTTFEAIVLRHRYAMSFSVFREDTLDDLDALWRTRGCKIEGSLCA